MYYFSKTSESHLITCHAALILIARTVIQSYDCRVICGYRDEKEQNEALSSGNSTKMFPDSKHNTMPSLAIDILPYPVDWKDLSRFFHLGGRILQVADMLEIGLIWGMDWNRNNDFTDQTFIDGAHYELLSEDLREEDYLDFPREEDYSDVRRSYPNML